MYDIDDSETEENRLILKNITFDELKDASGNILVNKGAIYPNGKIEMPLKFMPAINVDILYAGTAQDNIMAYRAIPENVKVGVKMQGDLPESAQNDANIKFKLAYSGKETQNAGCEGNFDFHFLTGLDGKEVNGDSAKTIQSEKAKELASKDPIDMQIIAELPYYDENDEDDTPPCAAAVAPALYSEITYQAN